jgi:hypothetical protein
MAKSRGPVKEMRNRRPYKGKEVSGPETVRSTSLPLLGRHAASRYTRFWNQPHRGPQGSGAAH